MIYKLRFLIKYFKLTLSVAILVAGIILSYVVFAQGVVLSEPTGEELRAANITFPIAELGGCNSKDECRDFCDEPSNISVCVSFARGHGLMNETEAVRAEQFSQRINAGDGPGGCQSPADCDAYCSEIIHLNECIAFADEHGIDHRGIDDIRKIAAYIEVGGEMPGGCTSEATCMAYCDDFNHTEECNAFAEKAGIDMSDDEGGGGPGPGSPEQFRKFIELVERGETPGGCKSKNECESYCSNSAHFEECVAFGEKMGFMDHEEAEMIRKTGGKGPGGCDSREACETYCNNPANQEACFRFGEEHNLIPEHELQGAREGLVRLRQGLEHAPPEVHACLKSTLGPNIIEDIQSGNFTPGPAIGERVKECFEKFDHQGDPREVFTSAHPEVLECARGKIGDTFDKVVSGEAFPTPEMGDTFRVCFQQFDIKHEGGIGFGPPGGPGPDGGSSSGNFFEFLRSAPSDVRSCLKNKLGDRFEKLQDGNKNALGPDLGEIVDGCFKSFRPPEVQFDEEHGGFEPKFGGGFIETVPPEIKECVVRKAGKDFLKRALNGEIPRYEIEPVMNECFKEQPNNEGFRSPEIRHEGNEPGFQPSAPPPDFSNLPPEVLECVKSTTGINIDLTDAAREKEFNADIGERVKLCFEKLQSSVAPFPKSGDDGVACIQVITPAHNPTTGICKNFPTPCDVLPGWLKGCPEQSGTTVVQPRIFSDDPAGMCAESGGKWDGSTCVKPSIEAGGGNLLDAIKQFISGR